MARTSRSFPIVAGLLVLTIVGLVFAIYSQRQSYSRSVLKSRLEADAVRLEVLEARTKAVLGAEASLNEQVGRLEPQWAQLEKRFYRPANQKQLERSLTEATRAAGMELIGIETAPVVDQPAFVQHVFQVRTSGPMSSLSGWLEAVGQPARVLMVDKVSVQSPDYQFQKVKYKIAVSMFEPKALEAIGKPTFPLEKLSLDLSYLSGSEDVNDPTYGATLTQVKTRADALEATRKGFEGILALEQKAGALEKLVTTGRKLEDSARSGRRTAQEQLGTLFQKVRASPLGSVALILQGSEVKFVEISGDE